MNFRNKTIALIGPASHTATFNQKDYINSFDVVIRINEATPIPDEIKEMTGDRCDVLYVWRKVRANKSWIHIKEIRLKPDAIWQSDWINRNHSIYQEKITVVHPDHFYKLRSEIHTRPNTGMMAMHDILEDEPKKLYITGITFYQANDAYYKNYVSDIRNKKITRMKGNVAHHNQNKQLNYFINNIYHLPNVEVDNELKKVCEQ